MMTNTKKSGIVITRARGNTNVRTMRTSVTRLPLSSLDIRLVVLQRRSREPVAADAPDVHGQEQARHERDEDAVVDVEPHQRVGADLATTEQERARVVDVVEAGYELVARPFVPEHRRGATHVGADRHGPDG